MQSESDHTHSGILFRQTRLITAARRAAGTVLYGRVPATEDFAGPVLWDGAGNAAVRELLAAEKPCLVTRLGDVELYAVSFHQRWRRSVLKLPYPGSQRHLLRNNAGFFPAEPGAIDEFAQRMSADLSIADIVAVWFKRNEDVVLRQSCPAATLIELAALNAMCYEQPWTSQLAGKRVLVIHPFAESIASQHRDNRTRIFADPTVLPACELQTLKPVQSIAGHDQGFESWFAALDDTCKRIEDIDFDVALIAAGAYGLALGAHVKRLGRQAVHVGGALQLLFGIRGRRWDEQYGDSIVPLYNDAWVRPLASEVPKGAESIEGGAYW